MNHPSIPGLIVVDELLDDVAQLFCVKRIVEGEWNGGIEHHRRTQHYGYRYDYRARSVDPERARIGPLPPWLDQLATLVNAFSGRSIPWSQAIVNEYRRGIGIGRHSDSPAFGSEVATISLGTPSIMKFAPHYYATETIPVPLVPGGLVLMTGASRRPWTHEISGTDMTGLRYSITLRYLPERL